MFSHLVSFTALAAVLVAIPGPAVMLIMRSAVLHGRRAATLIAFGVFSGDLVWIAASVTGLTAVLVASRPAFEALRYAGAAYLIYLGLRLLIQGSSKADPTQGEQPATRAGRASQRGYVQGALCELTNPKTLLVFTSVIPQFAPARPGVFDLALFGALFAVLGLLSLLTYASVLGGTHRFVRHKKLTDVLTRAAGAALAGFGIDLAADPAT